MWRVRRILAMFGRGQKGANRFSHMLHASMLAAILASIFALPSISKGQTPPAVATERIHFGDLIDVDVVGSLEFDWRGTITPEGYLDGFDTIEEQIHALCRTESEVAADLTRELAKTLRAPQVVVKILDRSRRAEAILNGAVRNPYRFQIRRPVRLNELLVMSGGITDRSSGEIIIFRPVSVNCAQAPASGVPAESFVKASQGTTAQVTKMTVAELLSGKANPEVLSGDIVTVSEAAPIYVIGGVNNPRQISSRSRTTVARAIASAGGLARDAVEDKVTIYRRKGTTTELIPVSLSKIKANPAEDVVLNPYDIVDVAQKGRGNRRFAPRMDPESERNSRLNLAVRVVD